MTKEDYVMFAVFNILFFQGIPLPWQTKRTVFRDRPFPIIVVNKSTRRVPLYINLIGINVVIIIIIIHHDSYSHTTLTYNYKNQYKILMYIFSSKVSVKAV